MNPKESFTFKKLFGSEKNKEILISFINSIIPEENQIKKHIQEVIKKAIEINKTIKEDPIEVVYKLGGFDIAAMAGIFLGSAYYKIPVVIDGFISAVAVLIVFRLNPKTRDYMFTSHDSRELGFKVAMEELNLSQY